ncbi:MAG: hypothetical protein ACJ72E_14855 [Marmoricola sp.]
MPGPRGHRDPDARSLVLAALIAAALLAHAGLALREHHFRSLLVGPARPDVLVRVGTDWSLPAARITALVAAALLLVQAVRFATRGGGPAAVATWVVFLLSLVNIRWGPVALGVPSWYDIGNSMQTSGFGTVVALDLLLVLASLLVNLRSPGRDGPAVPG